LVLLPKADYQHLKECELLYNKIYSFEKGLALSDDDLVDISSCSEGELKQVIRGMQSIKNALLLNEKRVSDPVEIAYRNGAIHFANAMLVKLVKELESTQKEEDLY
jgi:hypothetical protein